MPRQAPALCSENVAGFFGPDEAFEVFGGFQLVAQGDVGVQIIAPVQLHALKPGQQILKHADACEFLGGIDRNQEIRRAI